MPKVSVSCSIEIAEEVIDYGSVFNGISSAYGRKFYPYRFIDHRTGDLHVTRLSVLTEAKNVLPCQQNVF